MIIKASERGFGGELAAHLLNERDNDFVEVHAINGFAADNVKGAFEEAELISRGTKCRKYLFSVSLSPPKDADVSTQSFEDAISRVSQKLGLQDRPHVIVFHEKNARRHCHVVYSRIDGENMRAVNLPYYKNRLMEISKELYLENNWRLPQGFIDKAKRNPLNYSLHEWQHAARNNHDPKVTKLVLRECWAVSGNRSSFQQVLHRHGFALAKGDRRGFMAVDWTGKTYSLSRWCGIKPKALQEKLGDPASLPQASECAAQFDQALVARMEALNEKLSQAYRPRLKALDAQKAQLIKAQNVARRDLRQKQQERWNEEARIRQTRFGTGLRGLWDRVTGKHTRIRKQNELETYQAAVRDRREKDDLIFNQSRQRQSVQHQIDTIRQEHHASHEKLRHAVFSRLPEHKIEIVQPAFDRQQNNRDRGLGLEM